MSAEPDHPRCPVCETTDHPEVGGGPDQVPAFVCPGPADHTTFRTSTSWQRTIDDRADPPVLAVLLETHTTFGDDETIDEQMVLRFTPDGLARFLADLVQGGQELVAHVHDKIAGSQPPREGADDEGAGHGTATPSGPDAGGGPPAAAPPASGPTRGGYL